MLAFLGLLSFLLAALDVACSLFGISLTSVSWSPLIFLVLGFLFVILEALERDSSARPGASG